MKAKHSEVEEDIGYHQAERPPIDDIEPTLPIRLKRKVHVPPELTLLAPDDFARHMAALRQ